MVVRNTIFGTSLIGLLIIAAHASPVVVAPGSSAGYMYFSQEAAGGSGGTAGGGIAINARDLAVEQCYSTVGTHTVDIASLINANPAEGRSKDYTKAVIEVIVVGGGGGSNTNINYYGTSGQPSSFNYNGTSIIANGGGGSIPYNINQTQTDGGSGSPRGGGSSGAPGGGGGYGGVGGPASRGINGGEPYMAYSGGTRGALGQGNGYSDDLTYAPYLVGEDITRPEIIMCPGMATIRAGTCSGESWLDGIGGTGYGAGAGGCSRTTTCGWSGCYYSSGTGAASGYIQTAVIDYNGGNASITVGDSGGPVRGVRGVVAVRIIPYE